jgi:hypothetical protein
MQRIVARISRSRTRYLEDCKVPGMGRKTAGFVGAFLFLDAVANLRYPGPEPPFWYLVPSLDVLALLGVYAAFGRAKRRVPASVHLAVFALLLVVRLIRFGDGASTHFFDRSFNVYIQLPLLPDLVRLAQDSMSGGEIAGVVALAVVIFTAGCVVTWLSLGQTERYLAAPEGRRLAAPIVLVMVVAAMLVSKPKDGAGFLGLVASSGIARAEKEASFLLLLPVVKRQKQARIESVRQALASRPHDLGLLEGNDVLFFLVESYGEVAVRSPSQLAMLSPLYDAYERELGALGFSIASGILDAPTFGGQSWLSHATLSSGVKTENQFEYRLLGEADPPALAAFFRAAGYRTVLAQPGTLARTPLQDYLQFDQQYQRGDLGYRGPPIGWGHVPDQFTIHTVGRRELGRGGPPRFIQYALVSSHAPWTEVPPVVKNSRDLADGIVYARLEVSRAATRWTSLELSSAAFARAIAYDLDVLKSYIAEEVRGDALIVMLGDHQPPGGANEGRKTRGAPIHVISRRAAFVDAFRRRGYTPGMRPSRPPPYPGFETFLPSLLADFSRPRGKT